MGKQDINRKGLTAYQLGRLREKRFDYTRQLHLKRRVFDTFDTLLRFRGQAGLLAGQTFVDLGTGDGALVEIARESGLAAIGIDATDDINFEVDRLPIDDPSVDVVTAVSLIEHLRNPTMILSEALRILRPGGAIILVTPNWRYSQTDFYDDPTHIHPYTAVSLERTLRHHGFEQIFVGPWIAKKPVWIWSLSWRFFFARWCLPFRGDAPSFVPNFLKGKSCSLLAIGIAPETELGSSRSVDIGGCEVSSSGGDAAVPPSPVVRGD